MEHISFGITSDFDWYEMSRVRDQLNALSAKMEQLIQTSRQREQGQHEYIIHLRKKNDELQAKLNALHKE
jgi:hypothetical protein